MLVSLVNVSIKTCTIAQSFGIQIYILLYIDPFILKYKNNILLKQLVAIAVFFEVTDLWKSFGHEVHKSQEDLRNKYDACSRK